MRSRRRREKFGKCTRKETGEPGDGLVLVGVGTEQVCENGGSRQNEDFLCDSRGAVSSSRVVFIGSGETNINESNKAIFFIYVALLTF